jgi:hypothetical protein
MKKPVRPFSVEVRHSARKTKIIEESWSAEAPPQPVPPVSWPEPEAPTPSDARRAADAFFSRPPETAPSQAPKEAPSDARRILKTLDEVDPILRLLEEEAARRPRRGRRPAEPDALAPVPQISPAPIAGVAPGSWPQKIEGYVRGRIFARYVRRTEPAPGQFWRKQTKPAW